MAWWRGSYCNQGKERTIIFMPSYDNKRGKFNMFIKKKKFTEDIYLVQFDTQKNMAETFLRFQEYYESPKFMNKIFTLNEFKQWYIKQNEKFSYYKDWSGFNIPSKVFKPFREGKFNPLSKKEKGLLKLFENEEHDFYIIGVHGKSHHYTLKHEIAHGLFYLHRDYKKKVLKIMKKYNLNQIEEELISWGGYHKEVILDEIQAFSISLCHELKTELPEKMKKEISGIFDKDLMSQIRASEKNIKKGKIKEFKI